MADAELRDELMTLLVAGHETTATALAWALDLLLRHPAALATLEDESSAATGRLPEAVVNETLRAAARGPCVAAHACSEPSRSAVTCCPSARSWRRRSSW